MVRVLKKVIEKRVYCPKCGNELAFDDSDEKHYSSRSDETFILCTCGHCIWTRNGDGKIAKGVTLVTADATEEANNGKDQEK